MLAADAAPDDAYAYLEQVTNRIPGWLEGYAAIRTIDLLAWQEAQGIRGPLFEIGVFAGRYMSLLIRSAERSGDRVLGLDTFQWVTEPSLREHLAATPGAERLEMISGMTTNFTAGELMARLGARPRFISVDGSHDCDDVFWDMGLVEQILAPDGVVAADDFLNPLTLGVGEAIHKFFATPRNLAPFAYTANKLFLCRPAMSDTYREIFERFVVEDQREPQSANFRERLTHGRSHVEQPLWGRRVLVP